VSREVMITLFDDEVSFSFVYLKKISTSHVCS